MKLLLELLGLKSLAEDVEYEPTPIPARVLKYIHENGITYKAKSLEELKKAHAKALLRNKPDSIEKGLSYALGMHNLSKEDLEKLAGVQAKPTPAPTAAPTSSKKEPLNWSYLSSKNSLSQADELVGDFSKFEFYVYRAPGHWVAGVIEHSTGQDKFTKTIYSRQDFHNWLKTPQKALNHQLELEEPSDALYKKIGL